MLIVKTYPMADGGMPFKNHLEAQKLSHVFHSGRCTCPLGKLPKIAKRLTPSKQIVFIVGHVQFNRDGARVVRIRVCTAELA